MADKTISDFPELTTLGNDDEVLAASSGSTFKVKGSTIKEAYSLTVRTISGTTSTSASGTRISAPSVANYTFLCWLHVYCTNGATFLTLPVPTQQNTSIFGPANYPFQATALYVHN